jgi:hypothetical protein
MIETCGSDVESVMEFPAGRNEMQHHLSSCPESVRECNQGNSSLHVVNMPHRNQMGLFVRIQNQNLNKILCRRSTHFENTKEILPTVMSFENNPDKNYSYP